MLLLQETKIAPDQLKAKSVSLRLDHGSQGMWGKPVPRIRDSVGRLANSPGGVAILAHQPADAIYVPNSCDLEALLFESCRVAHAFIPCAAGRYGIHCLSYYGPADAHQCPKRRRINFANLERLFMRMCPGEVLQAGRVGRAGA